ncbi:hypothetical protein LOK49_LG08G01908 [Camellia lanceoleosa]|uniref:Uncharacterized protein n=1 Tax=Camellia lanceoleosa TaxID=1840588 RepID=A0ACC0GND3_9ERIC|nr:hypothetical protein LOK49_LG08G01908 [Camellia lanceoleosa]
MDDIIDVFQAWSNQQSLGGGCQKNSTEHQQIQDSMSKHIWTGYCLAMLRGFVLVAKPTADKVVYLN